MGRKLVALLLVLALVQVFLIAPVMAGTGKTNIEGFFNSCLLDPRLGIEMNEGKEVRTLEYLQYTMILPVVGIVGLVARIMLSMEGGEKNGVGGFFASCCIGPRVGMELKERKIRVTEWIRLVPVVGIVPAVIHGVEAYNGTTMKEIEQKENLKK